MSTGRWRRIATARWQALAARERLALGAAGSLIVLALLWLVGVAPAWRTARGTPAQIEGLDAQLQTMRRLAAEVRDLRALPAVSSGQAKAALDAAAQRLGDKVRLSTQGERSTVEVNGLSGEALSAWLAEVRLAARARVIDAQLMRSAEGVYRGRMVLVLGVRP